ncbi:hypothetical protein [Streptomyces gobiensis]|uniref:hypothetical protein n=1 Tax=Streptomyces gobiensis TaxID=2875706 RepID=UPI001E52293C|nr:hypothetical protein [Streptomyces gobiensis]UGY91802.1 hypothetical protein test1122_08770 [Streptomyces gobiensis]
MSAISLILLLAAATAAVLGGAALHTTRGLHRQVTGLREELAAAGATVPAARQAPAVEEVRAAVADALAEERERELAEARAFWAAHEARDADAGGGSLLAGQGAEYIEATEYEVSAMDAELFDAFLEEMRPDETGEGQVFLPRQADRDEAQAQAPADADAGSAELAAARRRHPSDPHFTLSGDPAVPAPAAPEARPVGDHERTVERLAGLAGARTALADVRPGPLGTLDVYVFADGTTVCMSPGHRETADRLAAALRDGMSPVLLGGSGVSGAYALTFAFGEDDEELVYALADRVIASL